jgi:hypothetical protein
MKLYLRGGPSAFPESLRHHSADVVVEKITVPFLNGREHFVVTDELIGCGDGQALVYEWNYHTAIAE